MVETEPRRLRADAERNRQRLIESAVALFGERGVDVGVGEIAERAGVGRGTLFRNFASKEALIAASVVARMHELIAQARARLDADDPGEALFAVIDTCLERQRTDRMLFESLQDEWLARPEVHAIHVEMLEVLSRLVERAQDAGGVRRDVGAVDVLLMLKGVGEVAQAFSHVDSAIVERQLDLVRSALVAPGVPQPSMRGAIPSPADLEGAPCGADCTVVSAAALGESIAR